MHDVDTRRVLLYLTRRVVYGCISQSKAPELSSNAEEAVACKGAASNGVIRFRQSIYFILYNDWMYFGLYIFSAIL